MSTLPEYMFDKASLLKEISEFEKLLATKQVLSERDDVLPFFKQRPHLSAFIAVSMTGIQTADRLKQEFKFASKFAADLVIGDSKKSTFFFVEFEDGKPGGILYAPKGKSA
ncbi:MAG TPA: hypothetical protein VHY37_09885 [Tepidisphaeraceae bacterium]|jgi:hypothetical protein|nr:hypothetical protein [Tepidisphaeraceae bacterium]